MLSHLPLPLALVLVSLTTASFAESGDVLWSYSTGGPVFASPALAPDGTVYIGSNDANFYALRTTDGDLAMHWMLEAGDWIDASAAIGPDGTVYVGTYDSVLWALDSSTGLSKWSVSVGEEDGSFGVIQASPAITADGSILVSTSAGVLHCIDANGLTKWSFDIGAETRSSPAIGSDDRIYFGADDGLLYCLDANGVEIWNYPVDGAGEDTSRLYSSPAIDGDGNLYIGSGNGSLYSIDPTGQLRWRFETPEAVDSSPAISDANEIFFASRNGSLYCVNQAGEEVWSQFLGDIFFSSPVIDANGFVYITYFAGQNRSFVVAFTTTGEELWQTQIDAIIDSSPTIAPDGTLYVAAFDGTVYALEGSGPLDYAAHWPRFRKDTRGRGRVIAGGLPEIEIGLRSILGFAGASAEWRVEVAAEQTLAYHWRQNGNALQSTDIPALRRTNLNETQVGIYEVVVSNEFGERLLPPSFMAFASGLSTTSETMTIDITLPTTGLWDFRFTHSTDLVNWDANGITSETLTTTPNKLRISAPAEDSRGFLRVTGELKL